MSRRAFTIVELLVVIAVVAVLVGLTLPALAGARKKARGIECLSRARQIVIALAAFSGENKGRLPENRPLRGPGEHVTWRYVFVRDGLLPAGQVWACPDHPDRVIPSEEGLEDNGTTCVGDTPSSFAINGHLLWREDKRAAEADRSDGAVQRPSHTLLIAESRGWFPDIRVTNQIVATDNGDGTGVFGYWHQGKGTYAFLDGHAEHISLLDTGNPDCRWHNGKDLTIDPVNPQPPEEMRDHSHPDWQFLVPSAYLKR
ncbi:MAG: prepilin-type N-terminal cleavage/methylation domain-containing protein [Planctomycetota bacterium]|nr:prepilin-type N-terminal cleavage/methylation domain-containing protein [Planctomycetota bacterium]